MTRTGLTDGQTDGRTGQKHYTPRNFVAWGIISHRKCMELEIDDGVQQIGQLTERIIS